jgi:Arc/MetJ-type ribon-helix-helix transcriptional regulator
VATKTVGFAIEEADRSRLERLVKKYGGGNRSAFLRVAIEYMEAADRAERLRTLQAYGAERSARRDLTLADVGAVVHKVLSPRKRR